MKDLELFKGWRDSSVRWVLDNGVATTHIAESVVVSEGLASDAIFIVTDGLYRATSAGTEIGRLAPGALFGEMAWLNETVASATVKALETSESLVLPLERLVANLKVDPAFAADFMQGVARVLARRLKVSNAHLLHRDRSSEGAAAAPGPGGDLHTSLRHFKEAVALCDKEGRAKSGLGAQQRERLTAAFNAVSRNLEGAIRSLQVTSADAADALGAQAQAEFLPYLLTTRTALRFYEKPRGYAGDFQTIEEIYEAAVGGVGVGVEIDRIFLEQPACVAVRNRRGLLVERIQRALGRHPPGEARIMSLACGPAREVSDSLSRFAEARPHITLLDIDSEALALVKQRLTQEGRDGGVRFVKANLIRLALGREVLEIEPQHLVYSIGLIDYFSDDLVVRLLDWIHGKLAPGGEVILGNFHPRNPDKAFMDHILEWRLIHRDEADMRRLFEASAFGACVETTLEAAGVNLFAVGRKGAARH